MSKTPRGPGSDPSALAVPLYFCISWALHLAPLQPCGCNDGADFGLLSKPSCNSLSSPRDHRGAFLSCPEKLCTADGFQLQPWKSIFVPWAERLAQLLRLDRCQLLRPGLLLLFSRVALNVLCWPGHPKT